MSHRKSSQNHWRAVAALALIGAASLVPGIGGALRAHEADPGERPRLLGVRPPVAGLTVEVRQVIATTITLRNDTGMPVEVVGDDGRPFLRVGPDVVQADVASPDFVRSESPSPATATPPAGAAPRFVTIADGRQWTWFEHRIAAVDRGTWTVPLRVGGEIVEVHGDWEAVDVRGSFATSVDGTSPPLDGLRIDPLQGAVPGLFVANDTGQPLLVPGPRGEPFLRIGPDVTELADGAGGWSQVSSSPRHGWAEPRIGWPAGEEVPAELLAAESVRTVRTWSLEMRVGDRPVTVSGTLRWIPVGAHHDGSSPPAGLYAAGVAAAAALATGVLVVRARRRPSEDRA